MFSIIATNNRDFIEHQQCEDVQRMHFICCSECTLLIFGTTIDRQRLSAFSDKPDIAEIEEYLLAFERICEGGGDSGPIGKLPVAERFRWLTATRSTVVQTSKVHPGLCEEPGEMLERLFREMVIV